MNHAAMQKTPRNQGAAHSRSGALRFRQALRMRPSWCDPRERRPAPGEAGTFAVLLARRDGSHSMFLSHAANFRASRDTESLTSRASSLARSHCFSLYATTESPLVVPYRLWPPAVSTTYCSPFTR